LDGEVHIWPPLNYLEVISKTSARVLLKIAKNLSNQMLVTAAEPFCPLAEEQLAESPSERATVKVLPSANNRGRSRTHPPSTALAMAGFLYLLLLPARSSMGGQHNRNGGWSEGQALGFGGRKVGRW
jgi:hypothetical protein